MSKQFVIAAKPELFEGDQLADWRHSYSRILFCYSFPTDIGLDKATLASLAKEIFIAHMRLEMENDFFGGKAPVTTDFFDRWWTMKHSDTVPEDEFKSCEIVPVSNLLEALDKPERDNIVLKQSDEVQASLKRMLELDDRPQGPNAGGILYSETDYFTPFPEPETVFAEDVESHSLNRAGISLTLSGNRQTGTSGI